MKYTTKLFCLVVVLTSAKAASIAGRLGLDRNAASFASSFVFPKIPGLNAPLSSMLPSRQSSPRAANDGRPSGPPAASSGPGGPPGAGAPSGPGAGSGPGGPGAPSRPGAPSGPKPPSPPRQPLLPNLSSPSNILDLFDIPNARSLIPQLPSADDSSDVTVPSIARLPDISTLSQIPGLSTAIQAARNHIQTALNITNDITSGIEQAIAEAFDSDDPTAAIRTIAETVINAYVTAAMNCPLIVVGSRVIQEGLRLAGEIARSAANVIFGNNNTTMSS